jgi:hypothetical protein
MGVRSAAWLRTLRAKPSAKDSGLREDQQLGISGVKRDTYPEHETNHERRLH